LPRCILESALSDLGGCQISDAIPFRERQAKTLAGFKRFRC
jgi:hypothetical protein